MRSALAYAPRRGVLAAAGPVAASVYLGAPAAVALAVGNPIVLGGTAAAVLVAGLAAGAGRALAVSARWAATLGLFVAAVNGLVSQRGETVLVRGSELPVLGRLDVTLEALAEGGVLAARIAVVMMAFAVWSACVDPDRLLRLLRPLAAHSALTATLVARLVPLAAADHARLSEAARLRGPAAAPAGRTALARRLVAGSLDRAVDVAATLELRGYGLSRGRPARDGRRAPSRHEAALVASGLGLLAAGAAALFSGAAGFAAYPTLEATASAVTIAFAAVLPALAAAPLLARGPGRAQRRSPEPRADARAGHA